MLILKCLVSCILCIALRLITSFNILSWWVMLKMKNNSPNPYLLRAFSFNYFYNVFKISMTKFTPNFHRAKCVLYWAGGATEGWRRHYMTSAAI